MKQDVEMLTQGLNTYVAYSEEELSKKNRINDAIRTEGGAAATGTAAQGEPKSTLTFKLFKKVQRTHTVKDIYTPLERMLDSSSCYDAIHVNDNIMAQDLLLRGASQDQLRDRRKHFFRNIKLSNHAQILIVSGSGPHRDVAILWKIVAPDHAEISTNEMKNLKVVETVTANLRKYRTKQEIFDLDNKICVLLKTAGAGAAKQVTSLLLSTLGVTRGSSRSRNQKERDAQLMCEWNALAFGDRVQLVLDRRSGNGSEQQFQLWVTLANELINEIGKAVHDRRHHEDKSYMSDIRSIPDFIRQVNDYWVDTYSPDKYDAEAENPFVELPNVPSEFTVSHMFMQSNPYGGVGGYTNRLHICRTILHKNTVRNYSYLPCIMFHLSKHNFWCILTLTLILFLYLLSIIHVSCIFFSPA